MVWSKITRVSHGTVVGLHEDIEQTQLWGTSPTCFLSLVGSGHTSLVARTPGGQGLRDSFFNVLCRIVGARPILSNKQPRTAAVDQG
jgi:hypothetical protein